MSLRMNYSVWVNWCLRPRIFFLLWRRFTHDVKVVMPQSL